MRLAKTIFAASALLAIGSLTARPQTNVTAIPPAPTQVVILGTLHDAHRTNRNYSFDTLRNLILTLKPSAILVELPPEINGWPTIQNARVVKSLSSNELMVANEAADALDVKIFCYDREGRNEFYRNTRYFPREQAASAHLKDWMEAQKKKDSNSIPARAARLAQDAWSSQSRFNLSGRPEVINSPEYDMAIATKHGMLYDILPKLLAESGERDLAGEYLFMNDYWQERNRIMARNIQDVARTFAGKRLVVLAGSEHRCILRELLGKVPELELKEFYQVPDWPGIARPTH